MADLHLPQGTLPVPSEPYRWVQAIQARREYISQQLRQGSPVIAASCAEGILLFTVSPHTRAIFEVYDRIALGGLGHPADLERIRLMAIDLAHLDGFVRSPGDVSVQRLANFGICPAVKHAFELIYEAPFVFRSILVELGESNRGNLFCRIEFDGSSEFNHFDSEMGGEPFCAAGGSPEADTEMFEYLSEQMQGINRPVDEVVEMAARAWVVGWDAVNRSAFEDADYDPVTLKRKWKAVVNRTSLEIMLVERSAKSASKCRRVTSDEVRDWLKGWF